MNIKELVFCIPMNGVQTNLDLIAGYTGVKKEEIDFIAAVINHMAGCQNSQYI